MRILVITQYFWPENFRVNDLVLGLKERGHDIIVLTGKPNYPSGNFAKGYNFFSQSIDYYQGIKVYRSNLIPRGRGSGIRLMLNYISFAFFSVFKVFKIEEKPDVIFVYEPSPITVGIPAIVAKWIFEIPMHIWVQDIWPHSLQSAGNLNNRFLLNIVDRLTRYIYWHCDKVFIQSKAFKSILLAQGVPEDKIEYFPNWTEEYYIPMAKDADYAQYFSGSINLIFAGNIGEAQDFSTLIDTAVLLNKKNPEINWIVIGSGRFESEVKERIRALKLDRTFKLIGSFAPEEMPKFFSHADALIVSLKKDPIFSITIPSKIQSYLACGKPILAMLDGEGSRIIEEANAGLTCEAGTAEEFAKLILRFVQLSEDVRKRMGESGRNFYEKAFERNLLIDQLLASLK